MPRNLTVIVLFLVVTITCAQELPDQHKMLATFGNMAGDSCIDDDFSQLIFCSLPVDSNDDIYFRIFDPDCGGNLDRPNGLWETNTIFELYGGARCISEKDARGSDPTGNYKSGNLLQREIFAKESVVDGTWVTFGPFKPQDGEQLPAFPGYVFFKLMVEGRTGDDGNVYGLFLSSEPDSNKEILYSSFFEYERITLDGDSLRISRVNDRLLQADEILLPVELDPIKRTPGYDVIVKPIDE